MQVTNLNLKIGDYEICAVPTGIFGLDGGAMFGTVPKVLWEKTNPPDDKNRIAMEARALLLKGKNRNILVDAGNGGYFIEKHGEKMGSKFAEMFGVQAEADSLVKGLKKYGLTPTDITDVVLTHLHFDHCGGGVTVQAGRLVPTFPKAQYYVQGRNLQTAQNPNLREKASYLSANFKPLLDAGVLKIVEGEQILFDGVSLFLSDGHTRGQQLVRVEDSEHVLVYCGDLIPTSSHIRLPFVMGYDLDPLLIIEEKSRLLKEAASSQKKFFLYFEHDPFMNAATVEASGSDFRLKAAFNVGEPSSA